ncbi:unnamed protein product [Spirodela intermedia]|uniref:Uncharacterized protein n=1 Tax=Spirodela intermedia TaxID=51605 RepID=A0A7I8KIW2_SPIIN|nr:unnamed protein product [Spirodela intermedia]
MKCYKVPLCVNFITNKYHELKYLHLILYEHRWNQCL